MTKNKENVIRSLFLGMFLFIFIQIIFMLGGFFIEKSTNTLITGIPSAIGLTIVLLIGLYNNAKGKIYTFLGTFILAFLSPLIVFLISLFGPDLISKPTTYYSLIYMAIIVVSTYIYFVTKLWRGLK